MRRAELINGITSVAEAIRESELFSTFLGYLKAPDERHGQDPAALLKSLKEYSLKASVFTSAAKEIVDIFGLARFEDPEFWAYAVTRPPKLLEHEGITEPLVIATEYLPKLRRLIQQDPIRSVSQLIEREGDTPSGRGLLSVILIEDKSRFSSPARIVEVLQSVDDIYEACAEICELPSEKLSVIACDSGSDKSFDFLGAAKVVECVKEVILSLWDRVIFFREKKLSQRLELIADALPIVEQIGTLERDKKIGPEQAELLRRKILSGVGKFVESGATIPEIEGRSHFNPRVLLAPEPKLLVAAPDEITTDSAANDLKEKEPHQATSSNLDQLTDYEREQLQKSKKGQRHEHDVNLAEEDDEGP